MTGKLVATAGLLAGLLAAALAGPAFSGPQCAAFLGSMGRAMVPDPGTVPPGFVAGGSVMDCTPGEIVQFAHDHAAERAAVPVSTRDALVGTWVSDDVLAQVAGIFIPVYEILEIGPGAAVGEVRIVQKLLRSGDPAEWFRGGYNTIPPVDVVTAGRVAVYGEHVAELMAPGNLAPRRVRYHDFPIESDRTTGLAMKMRMMSFEQMQPIGVARDGDVLVFRIFDRMAGGERVMTFRKRPPEAPENVLMMILIAELSMIHFHCFLEAVDGAGPGFVAALNGRAPEAFFAALREAGRLHVEREAISNKLLAGPDRAERDALTKRMREILHVLAIFEEGPLEMLTAQADSETPLGCLRPT